MAWVAIAKTLMNGLKKTKRNKQWHLKKANWIYLLRCSVFCQLYFIKYFLCSRVMLFHMMVRPAGICLRQAEWFWCLFFPWCRTPVCFSLCRTPLSSFLCVVHNFVLDFVWFTSFFIPLCRSPVPFACVGLVSTTV